MVFCDNNPSILQWGSEEIIIPYRAPDGKVRRYYPDFYIKVREKSGNCLLYTSPSPRDRQKSRMPSSA